MADFEVLKGMIVSGDGDGAKATTEALLGEGVGAREILDSALLPGMEIVGERMKSGECFIPEVLLSARTMQGALDVIKPMLSADDSGELPSVVIGTVEGDMHDIGKNLASMLLEGAGFRVINLGKSVTPAQFVKAVSEHKPLIVAMSGLLTTTVPNMPLTIQALKDAGLRDCVKVICGGAPVTEEFCKKIGADAYGPNAIVGVEECKRFVSVGSVN